jgi:hypothetical protein
MRAFVLCISVFVTGADDGVPSYNSVLASSS